MIGMSPMEAIVSATKLGGQMMQQPDKLGLISEGYLADLIIVDGDPLQDITVLQEAANLKLIMQGGRRHKNELV
jgi:imidazolonepropionase-like amidohydrolase